MSDHVVIRQLIAAAEDYLARLKAELNEAPATYGCACKICGCAYTSECADSKVCKGCRTWKRT